MLAFILRRLLQSIAVLLTVGVVAFSLFRYVGDPINAMVGQDTTMEERAELRTKLADLGMSVAQPNRPDEFAQLIRQELAHWGKFVKASGLKPG